MKYIKLFENYIQDHYLEQDVTPDFENEFAHKVESGFNHYIRERLP